MKIYKIYHKPSGSYISKGGYRPKSVWCVWPSEAVKSMKLDSVDHEVHQFEIVEPTKKYYIDKTEIR